VEWNPDGREFSLRMIMLIAVGFLVNQLAEASRRETRRFQETAAKLETAIAQVRRSERLAALGQLTAGLAHELRNPLGTMKTSAELLARSVSKENPIAQEMASYISTEVDRTNSLITRFLDFARPQHLRLEPADISALLDQAVASFYRERPASLAGIEIYKNYSPGIPPVKFDAELLERVFSNLILNAAQASPPGGVVTVKTQLLGDKEVEVAVIDRGTGIEAKDLESIFNPFFTTKADGVGLGLAICSKIVDEHGGHITVESSAGEGSVFHVILPV
jgi:signal transduction histidine kinase